MMTLSVSDAADVEAIAAASARAAAVIDDFEHAVAAWRRRY
jgi:hypothetical protein